MNLVLEEPVALRDTMESNEVFLPLGLVGFPELTRMEIVYSEDQLPFMWLQDKGESGLSFLVINPDGFLQNYTIELSELDAEFLEISNPEEVLVLNLVTVQGETPRTVYANLVGPVVINRGSSKGKQVVLENHEKFWFLDVFSGTGTISFTEKTQPEYLFRTLLPQCVSIMARLP